MNYPKPVTKQCTRNILNQMDNIFYKTKRNGDKYEYVIFCHFYIENKKIPVMIGNYDIINEQYVANNDTIEVLFNKEIIKIEFGNTRYFNKPYCFSVIEIRENNKIKFLELDDYLYEKESQFYYNNESIYSIFYDNDNYISVEYGVIIKINNTEILYSSYPNIMHQFWPLFNLSNNKLIGLCRNNSKYYNNGIFFKYIIDEFINEYKYSRNMINNKKIDNEIEILLNVKGKDINKEVYFLDNYESKYNEIKTFLHNNLKELNIQNTILYINNEKYQFHKYFKPEKEGEYRIKLIFNTNLTDCSYMFAGCENILEIKFIFFNTKYATNMKYMFHRCYNLKIINLLLFDTKNVTDMSDMFSFCLSLNNLDLSSFNFKSVINANYMFYNCINLKHLNLLNFNKKINLDYLFELCPKLNLPFSNLNKINEYINKYEEDNEIEIIIKINKEGINKDIYFLDNFMSYDEKEKKWKINHDNLKELNELNTHLYINNEKFKYQKYFKPKKEGEYSIKLKFNLKLTDCSYMFSECENIIGIRFISFNTKYVTNMKYMFSGCGNIKNINLSCFDTKNVIDMSGMFHNLKNLTNLDLYSFNTINVINMSVMFGGCEKLNNLDLSHFNTKKVVKMSGMFNFCKSLNYLNLSSFNTKNVIDMNNMFSWCENLNNLDLSSFDTKNVTNMKEMFHWCPKLLKLDLSSFNTKHVTKADKIFENCANKIFISKFKQFKYDDLV